METLFKNIRYGLRTLARSPGFTVIAVLTLGIGIGINTSIFSLISGILLRQIAQYLAGENPAAIGG